MQRVRAGFAAACIASLPSNSARAASSDDGAKFAIILFALVLLLPASSALSCGSEELYDKAQELAAINKALKGDTVPPSDRETVQKLYDKASFSSDAIGLVGAQLQEEYRLQALTMLHLPRIPVKPARELHAINQALLRLNAGDERYDAVKAMMREAEKLWASGDANSYNKTISAVLEKLQLRVAHYRC